MPDKEYKTYRQLLTILRGRGMTIGKGSQGSRVMRILEKENYYNVINGYKDLFLDPASTPTAELYKAGTTFDEVYALYEFDREVRHIYLKYLLKVENSFKTVLENKVRPFPCCTNRCFAAHYQRMLCLCPYTRFFEGMDRW